MSVILHLDTDLQLSNRIHKSSTDNKVRQITDKAQGIIFSQTDVNKQPVYNYGGWYDVQDGNKIIANPISINSGRGYTIEFKQKCTHGGMLLQADKFANRGFFIQTGPLGFSMFDGVNVFGGSYIFTDANAINSGIICVDSSGRCASAGNGIVNGIVSSGNRNYLNANGNPTVMFLHEDSGSYNWIGNLYYLVIYDYVKYPELFTLGTYTPFITDLQPFQHYQRYPEDGFKKLFISSKYLKDAVIDSADKIQTIYSSIGSNFITQSTSGNRPKITKSGIKFVNANNEYLFGSLSETIGTFDKFTVGCWHKPESTDINQYFLEFVVFSTQIRILYNYNSNTSKYTIYDGATVFTTNETFALGTFNYIMFLNFSGIGYFFINGVLLTTIAKTVSIGTTIPTLMIGNYTSAPVNGSDCTIDDVLISYTNIITPTGYAVGDAVFQPPQRGGFDGNFKIYPIP